MMRKVKFLTLGCKVNQYDTQAIRERFLSAGFQVADNGAGADIYVINTCTVTSRADRKSRYLIQYAHRQNPNASIVVTGCYTELDAEEIKKISGVTHIIKNRDKESIVDLFTGENRRGVLTGGYPGGISGFSSHARAFLKIQDGCNNRCSYCKVPLVRGNSRSRPMSAIIQEAARLIKNGYREIVLCGICLGAYGRDSDSKASLARLTTALEEIPGLFRIRLSSIEAADVSDELIERMAQSPRLCPHLHIPIQSGDDEILKRMHRNYRRKDYSSLVKRIKSRIPAIAITTDVLCGFPGEKEADFENTLGLIKEILPLKVHIFPFSRRKGTAAYGLGDNIGPDEIQERIKLLEEVSLACARQYKSQFLHTKREVLIEDYFPENPRMWYGYTDNYIKIRVESDIDLKNRIAQARLKQITGDGFLADI